MIYSGGDWCLVLRGDGNPCQQRPLSAQKHYRHDRHNSGSCKAPNVPPPTRAAEHCDAAYAICRQSTPPKDRWWLAPGLENVSEMKDPGGQKTPGFPATSSVPIVGRRFSLIDESSVQPPSVSLQAVSRNTGNHNPQPTTGKRAGLIWIHFTTHHACWMCYSIAAFLVGH